MNITVGTRHYEIEATGVESHIAWFYEIKGKRSTGALLIYKPETFGTCARVFGISELERMSDYDMTTLIANQTDLISTEATA